MMKSGKRSIDRTLLMRSYGKGCNCKKSGCQKNYCECYEAKIVCSDNCRCKGCYNVKQNLVMGADVPVQPKRADYNLKNKKIRKNNTVSSSMQLPLEYLAYLKPITETVQANMPTGAFVPTVPFHQKFVNFITHDAIMATVQCMLAQATECMEQSLDSTTTERLVIEEFGKCIAEIMKYSSRN